MQIINKKFSQNTFNGWDASKPLKALVMTSPGFSIAKQLKQLGKTLDFDVFILSDTRLADIKDLDFNTYLNAGVKHIKNPKNKIDFIRTVGVSQWAQDIVSITPLNKVCNFSDDFILGQGISRVFNTQRPFPIKDLQGGNLFYVKNDNGYELLVGDDYKNIFAEQKDLLSKLDAQKAIFLPQMDFHLDLFIRPLKDKNVLLADDNLTLEIFDKGVEKVKKALKKSISFGDKDYFDFLITRLKAIKRDFIEAIKLNRYNKNNELNKTEEILLANGYNVTKVPGRLYSIKNDKYLCHKYNFLNSITTMDKNNELVYMAGKSDFDENIGIKPEIAEKIDFSFEKSFIQSLSDLIKPQNIHFIEGQNYELQKKLTQFQGGLHCMIAEIPNV